MRSLIVLEMATLFGGHVVLRLQSGESIENLAVHDTLRPGLAVVILLALLLTLDEVGFGKMAAAFGGLVAISYLLAGGGVMGKAAQQFVQQYLTTQPVAQVGPGGPSAGLG